MSVTVHLHYEMQCGSPGLGSRLVVGLPVQGVVMCDSIAPGTLTIVVTRAAGIGNPSGAGTYALAIEKGALRFGTKLRIR